MYPVYSIYKAEGSRPGSEDPPCSSYVSVAGQVAADMVPHGHHFSTIGSRRGVRMGAYNSRGKEA